MTPWKKQDELWWWYRYELDTPFINDPIQIHRSQSCSPHTSPSRRYSKRLVQSALKTDEAPRRRDAALILGLWSVETTPQQRQVKEILFCVSPKSLVLKTHLYPKNEQQKQWESSKMNTRYVSPACLYNFTKIDVIWGYFSAKISIHKLAMFFTSQADAAGGWRNKCWHHDQALWTVLLDRPNPVNPDVTFLPFITRWKAVNLFICSY